MSEWQFMSHVAKALDKPRRGDARFPTLWPSEATVVLQDGTVEGKCRRATFFRYLDAQAAYGVLSALRWEDLLKYVSLKKEPFETYTLFVFKQGDMYEDFLIEQAKNTGVFVDTQVPTYIRSHNVSGKIDIEIINPQTGKYIIIECKSVHGYGGEMTIGKSPSGRSAGKAGEPKTSHLMQLLLYHWWVASTDDAYEKSRLVYGDRGTGRHAEFQVWTEEAEGVSRCYYQQMHPYPGQVVELPFTIQDILDAYAESHDATQGLEIPDRDFKLRYDEDSLAAAYEAGNLTKTNRTQYEKVLARREENLVRIGEGLKPKVELKQVEIGDWQCRFCSYKQVCYNTKTGEVQDLSEYIPESDSA